MTFTEHPRLLARIAGAFYVIITAFALFAYLYVRGRLIIPGDMAQTATNLLAHEQMYRLGVTAALIVVICNLPLGWIFFELLKVVNPRLALLALIFITASATLEAVNLVNYISPLFMLNLPEYLNAFDPMQRQAVARGLHDVVQIVVGGQARDRREPAALAPLRRLVGADRHHVEQRET